MDLMEWTPEPEAHRKAAEYLNGYLEETVGLYSAFLWRALMEAVSRQEIGEAVYQMLDIKNHVYLLDREDIHQAMKALGLYSKPLNFVSFEREMAWFKNEKLVERYSVFEYRGAGGCGKEASFILEFTPEKTFLCGLRMSGMDGSLWN